MKPLLFFLSLLCACCQEPGVKQPTSAAADTNNTKVDTTLYAKTDSITIIGGISDTLKFTKKDFNNIIDNLPELYYERTAPPDVCYAISEKKTGFDKGHLLPIGCETCKDSYYILYSYFLKKKDGRSKIAGRRDTLIHIYKDINQIFSTLASGGTYFGHQFNRIDAYAEYSIYLYINDSNDFKKPYSISRQKKLYIASLKQLISDDVSNNNNDGLRDIDKKREINDLLKTVDYLSGLITDNFYLKQVQEFQYTNY